MTNSRDQLSLFSVSEQKTLAYGSKQPDLLKISSDALQDWKQRLFQYQQQIHVAPTLQQGALFDLTSSIGSASGDIDVASIDPFSLPQQNTEFWRWKASDAGVAALYFVIDYELPILLYVGETVKSGQRWKGEHDCKRYLLNYRQVHYQNQLDTLLGIAFWSLAPTQARDRQRLETALIQRWRSPFNKENWEFWGTPFTGLVVG
ncbi:GIY-YIG nuclease family protein [Stenomitos frigidus]|uniref:GIY-YIG nuclease family protein n=1 Tax=Stenomitos frigidus TaxID=1886765 RepID=UPI001FE7061C|nr:GIY-YIG nuclease family protein [Stenomitos frigidus]